MRRRSSWTPTPRPALPGRLRKIWPRADRSKGTIELRVTFDERPTTVRPEMAARVVFRGATELVPLEAPVVTVPAAAVVQRADGHAVYVLEDGVARLRTVVLGPDRGGAKTIAEGLEGGEDVILDPGLRCARRRAPPTRGEVMTQPVIASLQGVTKAYRRGGEELVVLDDLDLDIPKAEFLALMGPSGSGKSTILNLLGGLDVPDTGTVTVAGTTLSSLGRDQLAAWRARHVGFVFQAFNLIPVLTALENVELPLLLTPLSKRQRREQARFALEIVGLGDRIRHRPKQLSGGQEQRVAIARAMATDPTLLLCDEPTGDLDRASADQVLDLLSRLAKEQDTTVVMVTHDVLAGERSDRVLHLDKGVLEEAGVVPS